MRPYRNTLCIHKEHDMAESGLRIRVDDQLKRKFIESCKKNDTTAAQALRAFMRQYVLLGDVADHRELFPRV